MVFFKLRKPSDSPRYPFNALVSYIRLVEINFTCIANEMSDSIKKAFTHLTMVFISKFKDILRIKLFLVTS